MEITGHKDIRMLIERYTHPSRENKSLAVKSLDNINKNHNNKAIRHVVTS